MPARVSTCKLEGGRQGERLWAIYAGLVVQSDTRAVLSSMREFEDDRDMGRRHRRGKRHYVALSELLAHIACDESRERVSVADLLQLARDRAFGALLFTFALPNVVPMPPGTSAVLGLPLVLLAAQFLYGRKTPWLPRMVAERSIARTEFVALLARINPVLRRVERILRPRLGVLVSPAAERVLGIVLLGLSLILFLPIPFGNMLPAAAICLMSLALVEHDGLIVVLGALLGLLAVVVVWGALLALVHAALAALDSFGLLGA
jgi:hypothetical protein